MIQLMADITHSSALTQLLVAQENQIHPFLCILQRKLLFSQI